MLAAIRYQHILQLCYLGEASDFNLPLNSPKDKELASLWISVIRKVQPTYHVRQ